MRRRVPIVPGALAAALALVVVGVAPTGAQAAGPDPLTSGGDPYFPAAGNGGYDVSHYKLDITYDTADKSFDAKAIVTLRPTQSLRSFSLDLRTLVVTKVVIDAKRASFTQADGELVITPRKALTRGKRVDVTVYYGGTAGQPTDIEGVPYGWYAFDDGAMVVNEPEGASTWYPVNDIPSDKATYDIQITVPKGKTAVANGRLSRTSTKGDWTTWAWSAKDPMASYLSTATVGDFDLTSYRTSSGLRIIDAVDRDLTPEDRATTDAALALQPEMIDFLSGVYGEYPFEAFGSIVDDDSVDYALETQTRPVYSTVADEGTVLHELSHQWVGNSVTPAQWRDIWLNEGFATYSEWLWAEDRGEGTAQAEYDSIYAIPATSSFWTTTIGDPGALGLFVSPVYNRGAATLHALRLTIGDQAFFEIMHRWTTENADGTVTSADLIELSEDVSGADLGAFFDAWLYSGVKPPAPVPAP